MAGLVAVSSTLGNVHVADLEGGVEVVELLHGVRLATRMRRQLSLEAIAVLLQQRHHLLPLTQFLLRCVQLLHRLRLE